MVSKPRKFKLPKSDILRGQGKFNYVFKYGKRITGDHVSIIYIKSDSKKIGFAVSRKVKNAVRRNRIKRVLREIYRLNRPEFPENYFMVLFAKGKTDQFQILQQDVLKIIKKICR